MESKAELRGFYRHLRESMAPAKRMAADARIAERVAVLPDFVAADVVFAYLSVGAEVDTRQVVREAWQLGKSVAAPRCVPGTNLMRWHRIEGFEGLEQGSFGIDEPPDDETTLVEASALCGGMRAVALVPGYSFDRHGYRLGYGGGFYDVFLPTFGGVSIGLCRDCQFSAEGLPHDHHDVPVDVVLTETRVTRRRSRGAGD